MPRRDVAIVFAKEGATVAAVDINADTVQETVQQLQGIQLYTQ